ncbi:MAG: undecaprenyl/decaprenyl-phosphate alpha-N-acetylglucosaminyl 1-phosphate transferase [Gammaproteobacteria bacterium]|nr:undecaprenyl/decaprenyl-phosphate alpha-N-acetylglucosaminyl 1-phosphate transferase [Gammaproteobacteria bacterium]
MTVVFLYGARWLGIKIGLVDNPGGRKKHQAPVPLVGGFAIFLSLTITLGVLEPINTCFIFWVMCCALVLISGVDDKVALRASHRFILHFLIVCTGSLFGGSYITQVGDLVGSGVLVLGMGSVVFTGVSVVGVINAVNMMDGIDGLTACVTLVEVGLLFILSLFGHYQVETMVIGAFIGALLAFLVFNFPSQLFEKYRVFLGDTGSMLIGLMLAWLCIRLTQTGEYRYPPALMLWILALPLMDTLYLMVDRKLRGVSLFRPDRHHIHHLFLRLNFTPRQTVSILSLISLSIGLVGIALYRLKVPELYLFLGALIVFGSYSMGVYTLKRRLLIHNSLIQDSIGSF